MARRARIHVRRRFEALEAKLPLAGDVVVDVVNGNLLIQGDDVDNQIAVSSGETPDSYVVRGLNGTVVRQAAGDDANGEKPAAASETGLVVEGVTRSVRIGMGDGDDSVQLEDLVVRGNVTIGTGDGEDTVLIGVPGEDGPGPVPAVSDAEGPSVRIGRSLRIGAGDDGDTVRIDDAAIAGNLAIAAGDGADTVTIGDPDAAPTDPAAGIDGDETPEPDATTTVGRFTRVALGAGEDEASIHDLATRRLAVAGGTDGDTVSLSNVVAAHSLVVSGGIGDATDNISLDGVRSRFATVWTGDGADTTRIVDSAFSRLAVGMGEGDDTLAIGGVSARFGRLAGGPGDGDLLEILAENQFARRLVTGFELPPESQDDGDAEVVA